MTAAELPAQLPDTFGFARRNKIKIAALIGFTVFLYRFVVWIARNFGDISLDQMLFHMGTDSTGVPPRLIQTAILELVGRPLIAFTIAYGLVSIQSFRKFALHKILVWLSYLAILISLYFLYDVLKLKEFFEKSSFTGDWYEIYGQPAPKALAAPEHKRNLIFIYVESLEKFRVTSATRLGKFSEAYGAPKQWHMLPGTQWTIAAMISSQCGVPQMLHGLVGKNNVSKTPHPLQNTVCMADILRAANYQTLYVDSANPAFAGKGNFFSTHGFEKVHGSSNIEEMFPNSIIEDWWGVPDSVLYEYTKQKLNNLAASGQPFYLAMNTVNTHGPKGALSPSCKDKGFTKDLDSIFNCSVSEVGEFLEWINAQPFSQNTVVVIMGDHPIMTEHKLGSKFTAKKEQEIFFLVRRPDGVPLPPKNMTHVDIFPTTLAALGFTIPNERLGLGHNIYNSSSLVETVAPNELRKIIRKPSPAYDALW